jgi:hypothetical protein
MHLLARPSYFANTYHACNLNISNPILITNVKHNPWRNNRVSRSTDATNGNLKHHAMTIKPNTTFKVRS